MRALLEITLVDVSTVVADGVGDVEREVVASFLCCNVNLHNALYLVILLFIKSL